jgi:hypothetical protein
MNDVSNFLSRNPYPGISTRALIRYNGLLDTFRSVGKTSGIDSDEVLLQYRSFSNADNRRPLQYPGLAFVGQIAQAMHGNAREQIGKIRYCLDTEALDREYPDAHFKARIELLEVMTQACLALKAIPFDTKKHTFGNADALRKPRAMVESIFKRLADAKIPDDIHKSRKKELHRLRTAVELFSVRQSPQVVEEATEVMGKVIGSLAGSVINELKENLETLKYVPVCIDVDGQLIKFNTPNKKRHFSVANGRRHNTSLAAIMAASKIASIANQDIALPETISNFNAENIGVTFQVISNAHMVREALQDALRKHDPPFTQPQIDNALDSAGFGFTQAQHNSIMKVMKRHARLLLKFSEANDADAGFALRSIMESDGCKLPNISLMSYRLLKS